MDRTLTRVYTVSETNYDRPKMKGFSLIPLSASTLVPQGIQGKQYSLAVWFSLCGVSSKSTSSLASVLNKEDFWLSAIQTLSCCWPLLLSLSKVKKSILGNIIWPTENIGVDIKAIYSSE